MASNKEILEKEKALGLQIEKLVTNYVKERIRSSSLRMRGKGSPHRRGREKLPMLKATELIMEMGQYRLLGFKFLSNKEGFVHHFGAVRANTKYLQTNSKTGTVFRKSMGNLKSQAFFDDVYEKSGAYRILEEGLSQTRTEAITIQLQDFIMEINKEDGQG